MKTTKKIEGTDFELVTITRGAQASDFNVYGIRLEASYEQVRAYYTYEVSDELLDVLGCLKVMDKEYIVLGSYDYPNRAKQSTKDKKDAEMLEAFRCLTLKAIKTMILDVLIGRAQKTIDGFVQYHKNETENWMRHVYRQAEYETIGAEQSEVADLRAKLDVAMDKLKEAKLNELSRELPDFDWAGLNTREARLFIS
jgi:hypothetical protein